MLIRQCLKEREVTLSCELFPPKEGRLLSEYKEIARKVAALRPTFISVTYGAGGGTSAFTAEVASEVERCGVPALAHLTCVSSTKEGVRQVLTQLRERGIENVLALRGDIPKDAAFPLPDQYRHADELIADIRAFGGFCIGAACYPEGHPESANRRQDMDNLRRKVDSAEISTKALDLRGLMGAVDLMAHGLNAVQALRMGIVNKAFDPFERKLVEDVVTARFPADLGHDGLFD